MKVNCEESLDWKWNADLLLHILMTLLSKAVIMPGCTYTASSALWVLHLSSLYFFFASFQIIECQFLKNNSNIFFLKTRIFSNSK